MHPDTIERHLAFTVRHLKALDYKRAARTAFKGARSCPHKNALYTLRLFELMPELTLNQLYILLESDDRSPLPQEDIHNIITHIDAGEFEEAGIILFKRTEKYPFRAYERLSQVKSLILLEDLALTVEIFFEEVL